MIRGKELICDEIESHREELLELSHYIHQNPELSGEEYKAALRQTEMYSGCGFSVDAPYGGLKTSFRASLSGKGRGPAVVFLAEYDALKGLGHACGHNIIAASAMGAALGMSKIIKELDGEIWVVGCPEEEIGGGKIKLLESGAFNGANYIMEVHPSNRNLILRGHIACASVTVEYFGKEAHSSAPEKGINALSALILLFNQVDMLRQTWNTWWIPRVNGIIVDGGQASNVIPPYAKGVFLLRAKRRKNLSVMTHDMLRAADAAARSVGAELKTSVDEVYAETILNKPMSCKFAENMKALGEDMSIPPDDERKGSSDISNVSHVIPAIHEYVRILFTEDISHTEAFREAAISKRGDDAVLLAAKGMAMTAYDILTDCTLRGAIDKEFAENVRLANCEV
jgi:amidohydrolase